MRREFVVALLLTTGACGHTEHPPAPGTSAALQRCDPSEVCCGNGTCDPGEDCERCAEDCANRLSFSVSNPRPAVNEEVRFEVDPGLIADPNPAWDLGNGVHLRGNPLDYRYSAPGTYRVILTATESACFTARLSDPVFIEVQERPGCGDNVCSPEQESCGVCPSDCPCPEGTSCAEVTSGYACLPVSRCGDGVCTPIAENCGGCPGDCPCPESTQCVEVREGHMCQPVTHTCDGDGTCEPELGEGPESCPGDCYSQCGNDTCDPGEDCASCAEDCGNELTFSISNRRPAVNEDIVLRVDPALIAEPRPAWDLGNGVHLRDNPLIYRYSAPGTYPIILTATESRCFSARVSLPQYVEVEEEAVPCAAPEFCGNQVCDACENHRCPGDCQTGCGNRVCDMGETCATCPHDCGFLPTFSVSNTRPVVGESVTFTATPELIVDPNPAWDLGNGVHLRGNPLTYTYSEAGPYSVVLTATDARCIEGQRSVPQRVTVLESPIAQGNAARLAFSNLPSCLKPGATYQAQITMENTGSTTWSKTLSYSLGAPNGTDPFTGMSSIALAPGDTVLRLNSTTFQFTLRAPLTAGTYQSAWRMRHTSEGGVAAYFGDVAQRAITVSNACTTAPSDGDYSCAISVRTGDGAPLPGVEVAFEAFSVPPGGTSVRVGVDRGFTKAEGTSLLSLVTTGPAQYLICELRDVETTEEPHVSVADPVEVPKGTVLALDRVASTRVPTRVRFSGLKQGEAVARLYQSGPYDRPVVIPNPFDMGEQTPEAWNEATLYARFKPFVKPLFELGYDVWMVKTKTGQNIHEQAAEFAQAIQYAASRLGPDGKVIVGAYSLGGVTARLATARWEDPNEGDWRAALGLRDTLPVSLIMFGDAPLEGAQLNACVQRGIWEDLQRPRDVNLNTCAAQQLLRETYPGRDDQPDYRENSDKFYRRGGELSFGSTGDVCDRPGPAPRPACVCDAGPALFELNNGLGFATVPTIAFSDGMPGTITCYGDERDRTFEGDLVCKIPPGVSRPHETQIGEDLYKVRAPKFSRDYFCPAEETDTEGGSRLPGDPTVKECGPPVYYPWPYPLPRICGGLQQLASGVFIPYSSALPWRGPFYDTRQQDFHGVHGFGYENTLCWALEEMNKATGLNADCHGNLRPAVAGRSVRSARRREVRPVDAATGRAPVTLSFPELGAGTTTLRIQASGPVPPPLFVTGTPRAFYVLATTAPFTATVADPITVCIDTTGLRFLDARAVGLHQFQDGAWLDITSFRSEEEKRVCGNATTLSTFTLLEPENHPPQVNAGPDLRVEATRPEGASVRLNGAATLDPDLDALRFEWRDGAGTVVGGDAVEEVVVPVGQHAFTLTATDPLGGKASDTVTIEVRDTRAPQVAVTAPASGTLHSGRVTFTADASDVVGVAGVRFRVDSVEVGPLLTTPPYSFAWESGTVTDGPHTLTAAARDAAGNLSVSSPVLLRIDNRPPTLALTATPASITTPSQLVSISVGVTTSDEQDPKPVVRLVSVTCGEAPGVAPGPAREPLCDPARDVEGASPGTDDREFKVRGKALPEGRTLAYQATYSSTDAAGNRSTATLSLPLRDDAQFISQSVPVTAKTGQTFDVSVAMKNTGTHTWTSAARYALGAQNPSLPPYTWGVGRVPAPVAIAPGATSTFQFPVTAPKAPGAYAFQWMMVQEGVDWFGGMTSLLNISVLSATEPVAWTQAVNVTVSGNSLTKTGITSWNGGAVSTKRLLGDGFVELRAGATGTHRAIGLGNGDTNQHLYDLDYGLLLNADGTLSVLEAGNPRGTPQRYEPADVLRIAVESGKVRYYRNGTLLYENPSPPALPLLVDTSLYEPGASLGHVGLSGAWFASNQEPVAWTQAVNVTVSGSSLTKTGITSWNGGAISTKRLLGDGGVELRAGAPGFHRAIGLGSGDSNQHLYDLDYGLLINADGTLSVLEAGTPRGTLQRYEPDDMLRVAVESGKVRYYRNSTLIYENPSPPILPLLVDASLYEPGASLSNVTISGAWFVSTQEPVSWTQAVNVTVSGNSLTKTGITSWNGGAVSTKRLMADGAVELRAGAPGAHRAIGLGNGDSNQHLYDLDYGLLLSADGTLSVLEAGTPRGTLQRYESADVLRVAVESGRVRYYRNGTLLYENPSAPSLPLLVDTSLYEPGASLSNVTISGAWQ
ncbi:PKD domain-containing protein [Myxococcaceae bacterium GXIMD 01537]